MGAAELSHNRIEKQKYDPNFPRKIKARAVRDVLPLPNHARRNILENCIHTN
jgi:hypothetical protein